jgi:hypothetical protein
MKSHSQPDSSTSLKLYEYRSLDHSGRSFRLFKLEKCATGTLRGSLEHFYRGPKECPLYHALSYTWGDGPARHKLQVSDNAFIYIRENLDNALREILNDRPLG